MNFNKKIDYYCLPYENINEGQAIYDRKFISALKELNFDVEVYLIDTERRIISPFPIWRRKINNIDNYKKKNLTIISHESLIDLCDRLEPDLFIVHNLFSSFSFERKKSIQLIYRFLSFKYYKRAFPFCKNILLLSKREQVIAEEKFNRIFLCEPPGIKNNELNVFPLDKNKIKRSGSHNWLPKKLSLWPESFFTSAALNHSVHLVDENKHVRSIALIEDQFLSGFKLKLLEMVYDGNTIISSVDLRDELLYLGVQNNSFIYIEHLKHLDLNKLLSNDLVFLNDDEVLEQQKMLLSKFSWKGIVNRIMNNIIKN